MTIAINLYQQNSNSINLVIKLRSYEVTAEDEYNHLVNNSKTLLSTYRQLKRSIKLELFNKYYNTWITLILIMKIIYG